MSTRGGTHRLILSNILQSLDIQNFLAQLPLPAWSGVILRPGKIRRVLKQLGQRLRRNLLLLFIRIHLIRARIGISLLLRLVQLRVRPIRHGIQLLEVPAQSTDILLSVDHILRLGVAQLSQSLVARQRDGKALVVAIMPRCNRAFVFAFFVVGGGLRGLGEISRDRSRARIEEE